MEAVIDPAEAEKRILTVEFPGVGAICSENSPTPPPKSLHK